MNEFLGILDAVVGEAISPDTAAVAIAVITIDKDLLTSAFCLDAIRSLVSISGICCVEVALRFDVLLRSAVFAGVWILADFVILAVLTSVCLDIFWRRTIGGGFSFCG